ncbi:MAG: HDOD domain-containing protein [Candidatus Krumholzibacteriia bacterium]
MNTATTTVESTATRDGKGVRQNDRSDVSGSGAPFHDILAEVRQLAPLSPAAARLVAMLGRGEHEPFAVAAVVETDPALAALVLRDVNSAEPHPQRSIGTVREAASDLDDARVVGMALALAGRDHFNAALRGYRGERGDLGRHSLYVALAARELAHHTLGRVDPAVAFTAGLLHDLGKVVLSAHLAAHTEAIASDLDAGVLPDFVSGERLRLGCDHGEAGSALIEHWRLPSVLASPVRHHHAPLDAEPAHQPLASVVHLADMLACGQGLSTAADRAGYRLEPGYQQWVVLNEAELGGILVRARVAFEATGTTWFDG